jgi:catechol 2,3-dioxygenase-like lactoylglutathione lyase family enzyme
MAAFQVKELLHINVEVTDLDRALSFYRHFGLEEIPRAGTPGRAGAWLRLGDGRELHLSTGAPRPLGRNHFAVLVDNLEAARAVFAGAGAPLEFERELPGLVRFFTRDPDGNRIEVVQWVADSA